MLDLDNVKTYINDWRSLGKVPYGMRHIEAKFSKVVDELFSNLSIDKKQKEMIKFLRTIGDVYPHEFKKEFVKLHTTLKQYENDPYERRAFLYLDILSWLESKIENKPIDEVIQEKFRLTKR